VRSFEPCYRLCVVVRLRCNVWPVSSLGVKDHCHNPVSSRAPHDLYGCSTRLEVRYIFAFNLLVCRVLTQVYPRYASTPLAWGSFHPELIRTPPRGRVTCPLPPTPQPVPGSKPLVSLRSTQACGSLRAPAGVNRVDAGNRSLGVGVLLVHSLDSGRSDHSHRATSAGVSISAQTAAAATVTKFHDNHQLL
jgi:hypothetical protein